MAETGKVFLRYLYKRFWWKVIHYRKKLFHIIHKRAFETSIKKLKFVIFTNAPCKGLNSNVNRKFKRKFSKPVDKKLFIEYTMSRKAGDILLVWLTP